MSKELWIIVICVTAMGILGICTDLFLSLNAYMTNPQFFIEHEANREAINFFHYGEFPFLILSTIILFPLVIFDFVLAYEKNKKDTLSKYYLLCIVAFGFFLFFMRTTAGLTWYLSTGDICFTLQKVNIGLIGVIGFFMFGYYPIQNKTKLTLQRGWKNES